MEHYCCCWKQEQFLLCQQQQEQILLMMRQWQVCYYWMGQLWLLTLWVKWKKSMQAQCSQLCLWQIWWMLCSLMALYLLECQSQLQLWSEQQAYCFQCLFLWMMQLFLQQEQDLAWEWDRYSQQDQHFDYHFLLRRLGCSGWAASYHHSNYCQEMPRFG